MAIFLTRKPLSLISMGLLVLLSACSTSTAPPASTITSSDSLEIPNKVLLELDAAKYLEECNQALDEVQGMFSNLLTKNYPTDKAVFDDLNSLQILIEKTVYHAGLVAYVFPKEDMRKSGEVCEQKFTSFISELNLSRALYDKIAQTKVDKLTEIDRRYREKTLQNFRLSGVNLDQRKREQVKLLQDEIVALGQTFDRNIRESEAYLELKNALDLAGLPQDYIDRHKPSSDGIIKISTKSTDYFPFMQFAESDALRQKFYLIYNQRAATNADVLQKLLQKRHELANLLGFSTFAELITSDKMIGSPSNAQQFIDKVAALAKPKAQSELNLLLAELKKYEPEVTQVQDWQKSYLLEKIKNQHFDLNTQEIRQYFRYDQVKKGMFSLVENLFDVTIRPWSTPVWHESVEAYELLDKNGLIGRFYLDMHPRTGKYGHAAQFSIVNGIEGVQITEAALVCNFPGESDPNALMEFTQVETFLHEFGHLIHTLFAGQSQSRITFSGIKTEWDFVEAPSQMLEEWIWDAPTLQSFALNNKGEPIPLELIQKMKRAKNFGKGVFTLHQLYYAALSLQLHNTDPKSLDALALSKALQGKYSAFPYVDGSHFYTAFGHLNGYSAIYYTYMWSLVIAADMHNEFVENGLMNKALAKRFREEVLAPGGQKDARELVRSFLGREYNFDAFSKELMED